MRGVTVIRINRRRTRSAACAMIEAGWPRTVAARALRITLPHLEKMLQRGRGLWSDDFKAAVRAELAQDAPPAARFPANLPSIPHAAPLARQLDLFEVSHER